MNLCPMTNNQENLLFTAPVKLLKLCELLATIIKEVGELRNGVREDESFDLGVWGPQSHSTQRSLTVICF